MITGTRNAWAGKIAGAALVGILGVWAGAKIHSSRMAEHVPDARPVPAGEASPPTGADFAAADGAPHAGPLAGGKIPPRLPDFSLSDRDGKMTPVSTWAGKSLVLNFWATWCAPCRREIPLLKSLATEWQAGGVEVVGVAVDHRDKVATYADNLKIFYPILVGEEDALDVAAKFGVDSPVFPFTVFTDRRGEVVTLYVGELHRAQADLILAAVKNVNEDRVSLAEAQRSIARELGALEGAAQG